jgi:hypothetical protein
MTHESGDDEVLRAPVSHGELLDKITILEIKAERIEDPKKLANVQRELETLAAIWRAAVGEDDVVLEWRRRLKAINESLWEIEDHIRDEERAGEFGTRFVELARAVYLTNDRRSVLKRNVSLHLGSELIEEKSYSDIEEELP